MRPVARLVDIPTAALAVDVRPTVIRAWIRRGHLTLTSDRMLDLDAVYRCERDRRRAEVRVRMVDILESS